jgi:hypothetical protein
MGFNEGTQWQSRGLVVAEGPYSRTTQWTPTLNLRTQEGGDHKGQVLHSPATVTQEPPRFQNQNLHDNMRANDEGFRRQLRAFDADNLAAPLLNRKQEQT